MKKVFFLIGTLANGGAERVVSNLSLSMNNDIEKNIILFGNDSKVSYPYVAKIINIDNDKLINNKDKIKSFIKRINFIKEIKKKNTETSIISFLEYPNLINCLTVNNGRTIISVRNHMTTKHRTGVKGYFWNFTIKKLYPRAEKIISVSKEIKRDLIENYGIDSDVIDVIYNSYDLNLISNLSDEPISNNLIYIFEKPTIITMGRLSEQKGHRNLLKIFSYVKERIKDAQLVILGEGSELETLKNLSIDLGIDKSVHFLNFKKNPYKYLSKADIFVMTSFFEGFPNAMAEAMACGLPVVSTDCPSGPREILSPDEFDANIVDYSIDRKRYGILVPPFPNFSGELTEDLLDEEKDMAIKLINLLSDSELKNHFVKKSKLRIQDFDINVIIKQWEKLL